MAQTVQRKRRGRDWKDPFEWFTWFTRHLKGAALFLYNTASGRQTGTETFTRASTATYVDAAGVVQTAASGIKRDRHYINGQGPYLLLEGSRTNLLTYSQEFDNAAWSKFNVTVTANAIAAPDGTTTGDLLTETGASAEVYRTVGFTGDGTKAFGVFLKTGNATATQILVAGAATRVDILVTWTGGVPSMAINSGSGTLFPVERCANGWYRLRFTANNVVAADTNYFYIRPNTSTDAGTLYAWGVQAENATFPSSYIPTTSAAVTRSTDALPFAFNAIPQVLTVYGKGLFLGAADSSTNFHVLTIGSTSSNNGPFFNIRIEGSSLKANAQHDNGPSTVTTANTGTALVAGDTFEIRGVLNADGSCLVGMAVNGGAEVVSAATAANALASAWEGTSVLIGAGPGSSQRVYGSVSKVCVAPGIKTLAQMRSL